MTSPPTAPLFRLGADMLPRLFGRVASRCVLPAFFIAVGVMIGAAGCNQFDPSQWTQEQVANDIRQQWNLVSVDLKPTAGGYSGSGKNAEGETFDITVKLDTTAKSATYHGKGDRGTDLDYSVRAEAVR